MKGVRFYLEFNSLEEKRQSNKHNNFKHHTGNVIAIFLEQRQVIRQEIVYDAIGSSHLQTPNNYICSISASNNYLRQRCKRISEALAREIHPNLFMCFDD